MTIPNLFDGYPWVELWVWAVLVTALVAAMVGLWLVIYLTAMAILGTLERLRATLRAWRRRRQPYVTTTRQLPRQFTVVPGRGRWEP